MPRPVILKIHSVSTRTLKTRVSDDLTAETLPGPVDRPESLASGAAAAADLDSSSPSLLKELFVGLYEFLDPRYDHDFRHGSDSSECSRGGEPYSRPWGWYRFALKVLDEYPDGNTWLGSDGRRSESSPGEWPVSFHGTSIDGARGIASSHYRAEPNQVCGHGISSTPDIQTAERNATTFRSDKTGKSYRVVMQNRINPQKRVLTEEGYWLIPVPEETSADQEKRTVEASIRPYGILIKERWVLQVYPTTVNHSHSVQTGAGESSSGSLTGEV
ncbi:hypothetical protein NFI96_009464 [Prochilodus magdalenae]|nr:hypothetical protein NFI96_009464 [Prochilodus magdalenae]